jgi:hypothetical protein
MRSAQWYDPRLAERRYNATINVAERNRAEGPAIPEAAWYELGYRLVHAALHAVDQGAITVDQCRGLLHRGLDALIHADLSDGYTADVARAWLRLHP